MKLAKCQCGLVMPSDEWEKHSWQCYIGEPATVTEQDAEDYRTVASIIESSKGDRRK